MRACTGKPAELDGIPHELRTTGYGVTSLESAIEVACIKKQIRVSYKALEILAHLLPTLFLTKNYEGTLREVLMKYCPRLVSSHYEYMFKFDDILSHIRK
jgi:hypothetical protein